MTKCPMARKKQWFEYVVKIRVHRKWVADGFDLNKDTVKTHIQSMLPYAYGDEVKATVLESPSRKDVEDAQA